MLMNEKIIFDRYYCINFAETKEIMVQYILQPHNIFIHVKAFVFMLVLGGLQFLIISTSRGWGKTIVTQFCQLSARLKNLSIFSV